MNKYDINNRKIAIIGSGFVGASVAYALVLKDIAREIVLIDIDGAKSEGEAEDIRHGIPSLGTADLYAGSYEDCANCDLIVVTAGRGRKPGETRLDLAKENARIMKDVCDSIKEHYTRGVVMIVSNPVDILTYKAAEWLGLPAGKVFGTGCMLDTARLVRKIADYLGVSTAAVSAYIIGEHGDSQIPVWSSARVAGIPIADYCADMGIEWNEEIKKEIADSTRTMGGRIIKAKGKTHYGVATCVCHLADAILNTRPIIESVSSPIEFEGDEKASYALSVPSVVGPGGVTQRVRLKWTDEEYALFSASRAKLIEVLEEIDS